MLKTFNVTSAPKDVEYQDALEQLQEQLKALEVSGKLMRELLRKPSTTQQRPGKSEKDPVKEKFGRENAGIQIGANSSHIRRPRLKSQGRGLMLDFLQLPSGTGQM